MEKNEVTVRLRGIYSTALAKILVDHGFKLTYPSAVILQRFDGIIEDSHVPFDLDIFDRRNRQGIQINGKEEIVEKLLEKLRTLLPDLTVFYTKVSPNGVYKGIITRINIERNYAILNLGKTKGIMHLNESFYENINEGDELLVHVEKVRPGLPEVQPNITIAGRYAVLIPENTVRISRKIGGKRRDELFFLGKTIKPKEWGILWRTAAASEDTTELITEIDGLKKLAEMICKKAEKSKAPATIYEENITTFLEFPSLSKIKLDEIRSEVIVTVKNHHKLKAIGQDFSLLVDFGERILAKLPEHQNIINEATDFTFLEMFPSLGSEVCIDHVKLNGRTLFLSSGYTIKSDPNERTLELKRMFSSKAGKYDGLDLPKEAGDYGLMEVKEGDWFVKTTYFSRDGIYKGEYLNINTPVEIYPGNYQEPPRIRYVDLEVDLIRTRDSIRIIDLEKLEFAKEERIVSEELFNLTIEKMRQLESLLRTDESPFTTT